jgi:hypothetical protein
MKAVDVEEKNQIQKERQEESGIDKEIHSHNWRPGD